MSGSTKKYPRGNGPLFLTSPLRNKNRKVRILPMLSFVVVMAKVYHHD